MGGSSVDRVGGGETLIGKGRGGKGLSCSWERAAGLGFRAGLGLTRLVVEGVLTGECFKAGTFYDIPGHLEFFRPAGPGVGWWSAVGGLGVSWDGRVRFFKHWDIWGLSGTFFLVETPVGRICLGWVGAACFASVNNHGRESSPELARGKCQWILGGGSTGSPRTGGVARPSIRVSPSLG